MSYFFSSPSLSPQSTLDLGMFKLNWKGEGRQRGLIKINNVHKWWGCWYLSRRLQSNRQE